MNKCSANTGGRYLMPYGFLEHLENKGYSQDTIQSYEKVIKSFFGYLSYVYKKDVDLIEISPADIKKYLKEQLNRKKSIPTINKELSILKTFFNYLWEKNLITIDPAVKIKAMNQIKQPTVEYDYIELKKVLPQVLRNPNYTLERKSIYSLALKGFKTADYRFRKDDVNFIDNYRVKIALRNREIILDGEEAVIFRQYYKSLISEETEYVFRTKKIKNGGGGPVQVMTILYHLRKISKDYFPDHDKPLNLMLIRKAYLINLYQQKRPLQEIAKILGVNDFSVSCYLKRLNIR